jgi:hypothetical protein
MNGSSLLRMALGTKMNGSKEWLAWIFRVCSIGLLGWLLLSQLQVRDAITGLVTEARLSDLEVNSLRTQVLVIQQRQNERTTKFEEIYRRLDHLEMRGPR